MANELPNLGADIVLEFQQSINNIRLFGEALEGLDAKFGSMENRINNMRASLNALNSQVSRGGGRDLRAEIERELNNLITSNGIVVSKVGNSAFKVEANTVRSVFNRVEAAINEKLAEAYRNIVIQVDPSLQVGKVPIGRDDFEEVNKAIARLVRVQLNNLVAALQKHGAGLISAQDLATIQFHIGRGTVQQIINKVKDHLKDVLLRPNFGTGAQLEFTDRDLSRIYSAIRNRVRESIQNTVEQVNSQRELSNFADNIQRLHAAVDESAREYIQNVTRGIQSISTTSMTRPLNQLSTQLRRHMAKELGTDLETFNRMFAQHQFSNADIHAAELRRQFSRLEQALNRKIGGGLNEEVKEIVKQIDSVQISYSPKLRYHLVQEINRINNQIVKKIREQIDLQFANMRAEIDSVQVAPKDINRARRVRDMGRIDYGERTVERRERSEPKPLANDPYARRDNYFNSFGLEGAIINTVRHILAGSIVGAPMMLMYQAFETFKTSQLEQLKMFSNIYAKADAESEIRAARGDTRDAAQVAAEVINKVIPFTKEASRYYAIDPDKMAQVTSIGSRLLDDSGSIKKFTDIVGQIYSIDREGDPVENIAPGLEAFMGQFDLAVGELEERVVRPLAVATNLTNATTEGIMNALMRSGSTFKAAGVTPEQAIAMVAASIKYTGLSGENIGNFYKSVLPRLQSESSLKELERIGIQVYDYSKGFPQARSAAEILEEVSDKYEQLNDADKRGVIMDLFGTYQSSKGMTTLDEFEQIKEIMDALEKFTVEDLQNLLANNNSAPIIEMQRAGVSVNMALTSILEELSPEIVSLAQGISNLAEGIRDHKEAIAGFIQFLGNALLGFATVYGVRRLGQAAGVPGAVARVETLDKVLGNNSFYSKWQREGMLQKFDDLPNIRPEVIENSRDNRRFVNEALKDTTLAPVIKNLANMSDEQIRDTRAYIQDNNLLIKDMKDLILAVEEGRDYRPKPQLTDEQRWGGSQYAANKLYNKGMLGIDENFTRQLATELQDRARFDQLSQTDNGRKVTTFLAGMDENELSRFRQHIEDLHRNSGVVIKDMDALASAVDSYTSAQQRSREEIRRTDPHLVTLGTHLDRVAASLNSASMQNGMRRFDAFLGGLSTKARGAVAAIGGLARTVAGFGAQMLLFAGIGELMSNFTSDGLYTKQEKDVARLQKSVQDINEFKNWMQQGSFAAGMQEIWGAAVGLFDALSPTKDNYTDLKELAQVGLDFTKFLNEKYGANLPTNATPLAIRDNIQNYLKQINADPDKIFSEFMNWGDESVQKNLKEAQRELAKKRAEEMTYDQLEQATIAEGVQQRLQDRIRKEREEGKYATYDLETVRKSLADEAKKIETTTMLKSLKMVADGYATDSEQYINMRKQQTEQIIRLYKEELERIGQFIRTLEQEIKDMELNGEDPKKIQEKRDDLNRWKKNQEEAESEFGAIIAERENQMKQEAFEASMSRIQRRASIAEANLARQEAINNATMDRQSKEYINASVGLAQKRIAELNTQIEQLRSAPLTADQKNQVDAQIAQLQAAVQQERVKIRDLRLSSIGIYRQDLQDRLAQMSNDYLQAKVRSGITDDDSPFLRNLRVEQYRKQVDMFNSIIADLQRQLQGNTDPESVKSIQREIRDLQRQSLQAQLGILDEMKNTGGTFNLPDNVRAMSYYEYVTRNNTHSTYTVQGGDVNVTITLPNVTDGTSVDRIRQIGRALGEGINEGKNLRLQKQANPFGYRG
jgi:Phage-related minor tail protein